MIERVAVVGAGLMGHGIAQLFAAAGIPVRLADVDADRLAAALRGMSANLELLVEEGVLRRDEAERALARVETVAGVEEAALGAGLVLEAITERLEAKQELFARIEEVVGPEVVLATNTSTLPLSRIAERARVPERFVVTHFFNPPHLVPLVEVLPHPAARPDVVDATMALLRRIGSRPILLRKEVPGLVANRLQAALAREALHLLEAGIADAADIDAAVTEGPGLRWPFLGPLAVADYGGLDVWQKVVEDLAPEEGRATVASAALAERVRRGELGTKSGQGFYPYRREEVPELVRARDRALVRLKRLKSGERRGAAGASEDAREILRAISDASADVIYAKDAGGRLRFANPATLELIGKPLDQVLGRTDAELLEDPDAARQVMENDRRIMERGVAEDLEERVPLPDGTERVWLSRKSPYRDATGRVIGLLGISRDVTDWRRDREALLESEAALDAFFAGSPGILNLVDEEFRYLNSDPTTPTYFGLTRETIVGRSVAELAPTFAERFGPMMRRVLETGEPQLNREVHNPVMDRPGAFTHWRASYFPVPLRGGRRGIGVMGVEITDLRKAEAALRDAHERLRWHVETMPLGLVEWDAEYRVTRFSRRAEQMFGWSAAEVVGRRIDELPWVPEEEWPSVRDAMRGMSSGERGTNVHANRNVTKDGSVIHCEWYSSTLHDADGRLVSVLSLVLDVTDRRRAEQALEDANAQLRESDRRKGDFLAVLSHELRNPLAPIRNSVYLLEHAAPGSEQASRARQVIRRQAEHMTRLIDDLLDVTRISRGKIELQRTLADLREIVRKATDDQRSLFEQSEVELRVELLAGPAWVEVDEVRIAQVVANLLHNAMKFTPAGGAVSVGVNTARGWAEIVVRDSGAGIEPGEIERMFEPFAQADRSLSRTQGGLGLGLALVKGLVELHGGTVRARSEGSNRGAEFVVALPLVEARAASPDAAPAAPPARGDTVLIIEDNVDAAQSLADLLALRGHDARIARDGRAGIALARELRPGVVLCDIGLPDVDGFEVARVLRRDEALRGTRLVALSGYAQPEDRERAREAGFDAHVAKPPDLEELMRVIAGGG